MFGHLRKINLNSMKDIAQMDFLAGEMLLFDKPLNWTSFDLVKKIRFLLRHYLGVKKIKVGHAGTLDPLASGLVIVCTGKATKKIDEYQGMAKEYITNIRLGSTTPTYDLESEPNEFFPYEHMGRRSPLPFPLWKKFITYRGHIGRKFLFRLYLGRS